MQNQKPLPLRDRTGEPFSTTIGNQEFALSDLSRWGRMDSKTAMSAILNEQTAPTVLAAWGENVPEPFSAIATAAVNHIMIRLAALAVVRGEIPCNHSAIVRFTDDTAAALSRREAVVMVIVTAYQLTTLPDFPDNWPHSKAQIEAEIEAILAPSRRHIGYNPEQMPLAEILSYAVMGAMPIENPFSPDGWIKQAAAEFNDATALRA